MPAQAGRDVVDESRFFFAKGCGDERMVGSLKTLPGRAPASLLRWALLAVAVYALTYALATAGLASASLFAALLVGIAYALRARVSIAAPRALLVASQAVIGVGAGSLLGQADESQVEIAPFRVRHGCLRRSAVIASMTRTGPAGPKRRVRAP